MAINPLAQEILRQRPSPGSQPVKIKKSKVPFKPRVRLPNEAGSQVAFDWKGTTYIPKRLSPLRPGAEDAMRCPSRVGDTYYYPLIRTYTKERHHEHHSLAPSAPPICP